MDDNAIINNAPKENTSCKTSSLEDDKEIFLEDDKETSFEDDKETSLEDDKETVQVVSGVVPDSLDSTLRVVSGVIDSLDSTTGFVANEECKIGHESDDSDKSCRICLGTIYDITGNFITPCLCTQPICAECLKLCMESSKDNCCRTCNSIYKSDSIYQTDHDELEEITIDCELDSTNVVTHNYSQSYSPRKHRTITRRIANSSSQNYVGEYDICKGCCCCIVGVCVILFILHLAYII